LISSYKGLNPTSVKFKSRAVFVSPNETQVVKENKPFPGALNKKILAKHLKYPFLLTLIDLQIVSELFKGNFVQANTA